MANREKVIKDILSYNKLAQTCTNLQLTCICCKCVQ